MRTWTYSFWYCNFFFFFSFFHFYQSCHQMLSSITDSFWIEKSTNHLCNNSFYELVSSHRRQTMVSWVGITVDDSLMQVERLPCRLSTPSQAHLQGPQRLWKEAYQQRFCCLITFSLSLSSLHPFSIYCCHSHLHSVPTPSFIYLSPFQCCFSYSTLIFLDLWQKWPRCHQRQGLGNTNRSRKFRRQVCSYTPSLTINALVIITSSDR